MNHNGQPTISVMMPCFNNSKFIEQAIRSVLDQDVAADLELVIVDDASTDDSVQLIRSLGEERIRLLPNETNSGISKVRNQLLAAARGDFITSLDGDDYYASNQKLSAELNLLMANDTSAVWLTATLRWLMRPAKAWLDRVTFRHLKKAFSSKGCWTGES